VTTPSPTVRQRELGTHLRGLRNALGMTIEEVAERLLCSPTKISRAETGTRRASLRDVRDLCQLYGVSDAEKAELMELAREAREQGWWTQYSDLKLDPYIGLEQDASAITCFTMYCFPALLQTEEYARAIITATAPKMDPKIMDQRVEVRLRRQQLLAQDNPPRYRVLLDEAVMHRRVGGPAVMADQLGHVLSLAAEAKATVQVIPFDLGAYAASDSNFVLLEFRDSMSPVIFLEGLTNHQYLERTSDLDRYREALEHLRDSALSPRDSVERIQGIREHYAQQLLA
jgi:transcriptional regulator with XRE-family HTH domain